MVKNLPANAGDAEDAGSIPGMGRSPGGRNGNPLQYSCLENSMDRGAWQATVVGGGHKESDSTKNTDTYTEYSIVQMCHSLFIHSVAERH